MTAHTAEMPRLASGPVETGRAQSGDFTAPCAPGLGHGLWAMIEPGLWVGNAGGSYIGMVERSPHGFVASDGRGTFVGHFTLLADAKAALTRNAPASDAAAADSRGLPPA